MSQASATKAGETTSPRNPGPAPQADHAAAGLGAALTVLRQESEALRDLFATFDSGDGRQLVGRALDILHAVTGRVIVTGMGKSGHVARKIAATMASTGTPAQFVHPAEASHGDMGMVTSADAVLALSNSGETVELADLITYSRRWRIPLIAMTSRGKSTLGNAADVTLALPPTGEAGALGLAPTSSTTMMLALGDALALGLLERKGFSAEDFHQLHPGGKLGQKLLRVGDLMHRAAASEVPLIAASAPMGQALIEMTSKTFGCVGAVDAEGDLVGIITDGDLRRHMGDALLKQDVAAVMTARPLTITAQALAAEAVLIMNERSITTLFVVDGTKPVGIIRLHDCLRAGVA
ncbi:SIS domain-containing protein [Dongia sp.]|jgi:arabinose-5-phosphate isomerase|uniref:KpsF/GutQ family sugar-phosphate isomerase n=1 Tax=Dongia sp. TaxID=1977262 RepID=UPI0035AE196A